MELGDLLNVLWALLMLQFFVPLVQKQILLFRRQRAMRAFETGRRSRLITLIHRQETMSLLGIPIARYIDIEDSEQVLRAIRMTPADMPIDLILHTPGGVELAAEQIAWALQRHEGKVTVFVPHYAMSGGTLIAIAADEIVMDPNAVLGPVDPVLGTAEGGGYPAASIIQALEQPNPNRSDEILILGDVARKAVRQTYDAVHSLLIPALAEPQAAAVARALTDGRWTHDHAIGVLQARELGLRVGEEIPDAVHNLMELYPQAARERQGVEFIPVPYPRLPAPAKTPRERAE